MSDWPLVYVIFATHKRTETALRTLESLRDHLQYPNLHYHIAVDGGKLTDDGTEREQIHVLMDRAREWTPNVSGHFLDTPDGQFNTGKNINLGIQHARKNGCSIYHLNFDDWALFRDLDIRPMVDILDTYDYIGFVRLSYQVPGLGGLTHRIDSPRTTGCWIWFRLIREWCLRNPWETQGYLVSTQPYVAHMRFHEAYGMHPENVSPGHAEIGLGGQYNGVHDESKPWIVFPVGACSVHAPWDHSAARAHDYAEQFPQG